MKNEFSSKNTKKRDETCGIEFAIWILILPPLAAAEFPFVIVG